MNDILFKTVMLKGDKGDPGENGADGAQIASIEKTATVGLIDTYTITLNDGSTTQFEIKNGEDAQLYELPQGAVIAYDDGAELVTETSDNSNEITITEVSSIRKIMPHGITKQNSYTGKNLFPDTAGAWQNGYINGSTGALVSSSSGRDQIVYTDFIKIDSNNPVYISFESFPTTPAWFYINAYSANDGTGYLGETRVRPGTGILYQNNLNAAYIRIWCYNGGQTATNLIPVKLQIEKGTSATDYEPYCGGVPSPSPDYPQPLQGIGTAAENDTYTVSITVTDNDLNEHVLTASGLTRPLYEGDKLDFINGKVIRAQGYIQSYNGEPIGNVWRSSFELWQPNTTPTNGATVIFPLTTPVEENVTITGDPVANLRLTVAIAAPEDVTTLEVEFYQNASENPPGYEDFDAQFDTELNDYSRFAPETRAVYNELYFKDGDEIITGDNVDNPAPLLLGHCTTTYYRVVMQLPKRLTENQTVEVEQLSSMQIFTSAGSSYVSPGSYDIGVKIVRELNQLRITFNAPTDPDRGGICAISGQFKITISEEV